MLKSSSFALSDDAATCPECGSLLNIEINEWRDDGTPDPAGIDIYCVEESEMLARTEDGDADAELLQQYTHRHHQAEWMSVHGAVEEWCTKNVRRPEPDERQIDMFEGESEKLRVDLVAKIKLAGANMNVYDSADEPSKDSLLCNLGRYALIVEFDSAEDLQAAIAGQSFKAEWE